MESKKTLDASEQLIKALDNYLNVMGRNDTKVVKHITSMHRTLQQETFKLFIRCVNEWNQTELWDYDPRNEHTVRMSKRIMSIENIDAIPFI
jgi:hypothetical protein